MNIFIVSFVFAETFHRAFFNLRVISIAQVHSPNIMGPAVPKLKY
jgi:hypothetical protein